MFLNFVAFYAFEKVSDYVLRPVFSLVLPGKKINQ